jgi:hypothetical protein
MAIILDGSTGITTPATISSGPVSGSTGTFSGAVQVSGIASNLYPLVSGTSVASTSGTAIDFTSIPSWAKRITVMFSGVSTTGTSTVQVQLGTSGGFVSSGYLGTNMAITASGVSALISTGFTFNMASQDIAAAVRHGQMVLTNITGNTWLGSGHLVASHAVMTTMTSGSIALAGTFDRIRVTTVNGTDTFDAGIINIMYE